MQEQTKQNVQQDLSAITDLEAKHTDSLAKAAEERQALQEALSTSGTQAERLASVAETLTTAGEQFQEQTQQNVQPDLSLQLNQIEQLDT